MGKVRFTRGWGVAACGLTLAVTAACGSSDAKTGSGSGDAAEVNAAKTVVAEWQKPMSGVTVTEPLKAKPAAGETIVSLTCDAPLCDTISDGVEKAGAAAGWKVRRINFQAADPATIVAAFRQALQYDPAAVTVPGIPPEAGWSSVLNDYEKADVPIIVSFMHDIELDGAIKGNVADGTVWRTKSAEIVANWIIADSGGTAHVLNQRIDAFAGVKAFSDEIAAVLEEKCSACKVTELSNTPDQASSSGIVPTIIPALQRDPSIDYVVGGTLENLDALPSALSAANLKVKITGQTPSKNGYQLVKDGKFASATVFPGFYSGWLIVDTALRLNAGQALDPGDTASLPNQLITPESEFEVLDSYDPTGYEDAFKKLWQVG